MLGRPAQYAILAMTYLARLTPGRLVPIRQVGEEVGVPRPFLAKILASLSRHDLVATRRGPNGGVMLARGAARITIGQIVEVFEGPPALDHCFLGLPECSDEDACPFHEDWKRIREQLRHSLHARTLRDLADTRALQGPVGVGLGSPT